MIVAALYPEILLVVGLVLRVWSTPPPEKSVAKKEIAHDWLLRYNLLLSTLSKTKVSQFSDWQTVMTVLSHCHLTFSALVNHLPFWGYFRDGGFDQTLSREFQLTWPELNSLLTGQLVKVFVPPDSSLAISLTWPQLTSDWSLGQSIRSSRFFTCFYPLFFRCLFFRKFICSWV